MPFQPSDTLKSRTFLGLILSQFLAAFNDQAIHASAMFYAINETVLSEYKAISLMPILFYAPWAIFCTLAGYLADRFSKRSSLVFWKVAEVFITLIALGGFWLGSGLDNPLGPWIVLSTVFLMGMHSAFFVPAKYGVMPEILQPQVLSRGNGVLESTSFLAVIMGTVSGGLLSSLFRDREYVIGFILVALAVLGVFASLLIRRMPAANPTRRFPWHRDKPPWINLVEPLWLNLKSLLLSRPLALAVLGIAFFTFMVAFMRGTVYMHGESQNPRWTELQTSLVVATVALGVGLGSPLAGFLSGGKVELGLVPIGAVGMILACLGAAVFLFEVPGLIACLIVIGFFSGFYIVPLYTLLQHRAPKTSKGDLIATSNFVNVTGAILASLLFYGLVGTAKLAGVAHAIPQQPLVEATGRLKEVEKRPFGGAPAFVAIEVGGNEWAAGRRPKQGRELSVTDLFPGGHSHGVVIHLGEGIEPGAEVAVSQYELRGVHHYDIRRASAAPQDAYDQALVPRFLFIAASLMTLGILILLCRQLPDFFVRALLWLRSHGRYRLKVVGMKNLPSDGPVILATNCDRFESCMQVLAATDRYTRFILLESAADPEPRPLLRYLARRTGLVALKPGITTTEQWHKAYRKAAKTLETGNLLAVTVDSAWPTPDVDQFLDRLRGHGAAVVLPIFCGGAPSDPSTNGRPVGPRRVNVVIGAALPADVSPQVIREHIRQLGDGLHEAERIGTHPHGI